MSSKDMINKRILDEIDALRADKDIKQFLREILLFELDIIDQGRPAFKDKYIEIMNKIF
jgi:hypothetical protein